MKTPAAIGRGQWILTDKNLGQPARALSEDTNRPSSPADGVPMSIVVNGRGRACLLHTKPFTATPVWVKYLIDQRKVKLIFDNGAEHVIDHTMDDKVHKLLLNVTKLFLIRLENGVPVEGYDTNIIKG